MDLSSASDQPSGVRRRLSSRKAAQLRSLFCSCTPTARLETESDDAVLLHRKISRSEGRIAAVHPPAPRRERKKSVIIIPLPAACIVSSSIIFLLLFSLFLASVSEAVSSRRIQPLPKDIIQPEVYHLEDTNFPMIFGDSAQQYDSKLHLKKRVVPLIEGYKGRKLQAVANQGRVNKDDLSKIIEDAVQLANGNRGTAVKMDHGKLAAFDGKIREVRAIVPPEGDAVGDDLGTAIFILWGHPEIHNRHKGVVLVSGKPEGWYFLDEAKRQKAVEVSAKNALTLLIENNKDIPNRNEMNKFIKVFATHPIFGMPSATMKGYIEMRIPGFHVAPLIDFLDRKRRFFPALEEISRTDGKAITKEADGPLKDFVLALKNDKLL